MAQRKLGRGRAASQNLTHLDHRGRLTMVDVGAKAITRREAVARAELTMAPATLTAITAGTLHKGEALAAARVAAVMAAKRACELIPLCHQIPLDAVQVDFLPDPARGRLAIQARALTHFRTGVEIEAMVAAATAALTIYDMAKAIDRSMVIGNLRLVSKQGGRSGKYLRPGEPPWPD